MPVFSFILRLYLALVLLEKMTKRMTTDYRARLPGDYQKLVPDLLQFAAGIGVTSSGWRLFFNLLAVSGTTVEFKITTRSSYHLPIEI
jgi:hypothetical protein